MPTALFLSPHLDDVAFSCGGAAAALRRAGWRVAVATVFTASVRNPTGFALACQLDKGLDPAEDYMALRRAEDAAFARVVGVDDLLWLGLLEAPHRGYASAPELFDAVRPEDDSCEQVTGAVADLDARMKPAVVFAPQGVGGHVDHRQVVKAVLSVPGLAGRTAWYRDLPYAARRPDAQPDPSLPPGIVEAYVALGADDLRAKLDGCACYTSQLGFQFGGEAPMRRVLGGDAYSEAGRSGRGAAAERFLATAELAGWLSEAVG